MLNVFIQKTKSQGFIQGIFVIFCLISFDQIIKYWIVNQNVFYTCNYGIAFGIKLPVYLLGVCWIAIMLYLCYLWWSKRKLSFFQQLPFILIMAGGLSNMIDRILYGCVVDYVPFFNISVFNLADVFITGGVILIIVGLNRNTVDIKNL